MAYRFPRRTVRWVFGLGLYLLYVTVSLHIMFKVMISTGFHSHLTAVESDEKESHAMPFELVQSRHVQPNLTTEQKRVWEELRARRQRVEQVCANNTPHNGRVQGVFFNKDKRLAYCFVPKTGCTFWKQLFGFLNKDTGLKTPVRSPFDIPRLVVHFNKYSDGRSWKAVWRRVHDYLRFMFSRDPYSRLWSTYLDKFFLPDFWTKFGRKVMQKRRPQPSRRAIFCGNNVSFAEFIKFSLEFNEPHWTPVSLSCDPCQFKPEVIGKMDTYTRDARTVLDWAGLGWVLEGVDHDKHSRNEIEMLIRYNFDVIYKKRRALSKYKCISDQKLGERLWTTFHYNGYISDRIPYQAPSPFSQQSFTKLVLGAVSASASYGKDSLKQQRKGALETAFKKLPKKILERIASRYDLDFEMFGYCPRTFT